MGYMCQTKYSRLTGSSPFASCIAPLPLDVTIYPLSLEYNACFTAIHFDSSLAHRIAYPAGLRFFFFAVCCLVPAGNVQNSPHMCTREEGHKCSGCPYRSYTSFDRAADVPGSSTTKQLQLKNYPTIESLESRK